MNEDCSEVFPFGGSLIIDFGGNEPVTVMDLDTDEASDIPLVSQCPN